MVHHERNFVLIKDILHRHLIHLVNSDWGCDIIAENKVQLCFDQLPRLDGVKTRVACEDLLRHGHSHN